MTCPACDPCASAGGLCAACSAAHNAERLRHHAARGRWLSGVLCAGVVMVDDRAMEAHMDAYWPLLSREEWARRQAARMATN